MWKKTPAIHLLLRTNVLKEPPRELKNMSVCVRICVCRVGGLCLFLHIYNKRAEPYADVHAYRVKTWLCLFSGKESKT